MLPTEQYRAKAAEFGELAKAANNPADAQEFQQRAQSLIALADNEQWLIDHPALVVHKSDSVLADVSEPATPIERWDDDGGAPKPSQQTPAAESDQ